MAERTPVVKKYRDALETVMGATMEFLAHAPEPNRDPLLTSPPSASGDGKKGAESYERASISNGSGTFEYTPDEAGRGSGLERRREGRQGEMGQMDAEWMLSLCEQDGFSLSMLNEMMRFEPSLGA